MSILSGAHDFVITNSQFFDVHATQKTGLDILLKTSLPEASHDSSARDPPPQCFPGTREQYIKDIIHWAQAPEESTTRIMWMQGPAGVGKSAVAQTCAEKIGRGASSFGASFFFARVSPRNNPNCLFTSIAYQLSTRSPPYAEIIDSRIRHDPTLVTKSISTQFTELIVGPFQELKARGVDIGNRVVIIDGLDECTSDEAQSEILTLIVSSVRERTTPLLWAIFSRPEPHITAVFESSEDMAQHCWKIGLPVSRDADGDIELYLQDGFKKIRTKYHFSSAAWPTEEDLGEIVRRSAGLFIYAATVLRFIGEPGSHGPEHQLRAILLVSNSRNSDNSQNPFLHLDIVYTLIMENVPISILPTTQQILLSMMYSHRESVIANLLGISSATLHAALLKLHSVVQMRKGHSPTRFGGFSMRFYHRSFDEFLESPSRSMGFCAKASQHVNALLRNCLRVINEVHGKPPLNSPEGQIPDLSLSWRGNDDISINLFSLRLVVYEYAVETLLQMWTLADTVDNEVLEQLRNLDFAQTFVHSEHYPIHPFYVRQSAIQTLQRLDGELARPYRPSIIAKLLSPTRASPQDTELYQVYVVGRGNKKAFLVPRFFGQRFWGGQSDGGMEYRWVGKP